jgi:hypothetical protein
MGENFLAKTMVDMWDLLSQLVMGRGIGRKNVQAKMVQLAKSQSLE